ncbi:MAG: phosphoribosylamine--glycine ligase [Rhodospirillales bacterium]|nr:phosphoribosylamine--glycine ligase [Rhodospirillales bacterium]
MRVLLVGSGGREHALAWAIAASPLCDKLFCAPGNAGIANEAECVPINVLDTEGLVGFARENRVDFVVVGPEAPLVAGLVDRLEAAGIAAFGPSAAAARLEGSKGFMKDFCARHDIPTAAYRRFSDAEAAKDFIRSQGAPIVVKADGLAAGKGVIVARTIDEALAAADALQRYGGGIVVEEFLEGEEASFFALVDGRTALPLASAQDHKRVGDGDTGPNTGGMGAYSPAPCVTPAIAEEVMARMIRPTVAGMAAEGTPFTGVLFAGLMLTAKGPRLLEYNVRFGDPECQPLMMRLESDLLTALVAARDGVLDDFALRWRDDTALCVVLAAKGYPGDPKKGGTIEGIEAAESDPAVKVFQAGTKRTSDGRIVADGGRVLGVTALGRTPGEAQRRAYDAVDKIVWEDGFCRRDIGWRVVGRDA